MKVVTTEQQIFLILECVNCAVLFLKLANHGKLRKNILVG